jgi:ornithine cyclodeaminase/alanine dehydrogenase
VTLVLGAYDIEALISGIDVIAEMEAIHADLGTGAMEQQAPPSLRSGTDDSVFLPMSARSDRLGLVVVKTLADVPANAARGLPVQRSTLLVTSAVTGECVAVLDGAVITRHRTAATSAVATRHLAAGDSRVLGLIGAGQLAVHHARMLAAVMQVQQIVVWSRSAATIDAFLEGVGSGLAQRTTIAPDPRSVAEAADIICTLTPSRTPILHGAWLRPGQHVNAVGAPPRPTHRELDGEAMARSTLVVDSAATALAKSGDLLQAIAEGALPGGRPLREIGAVIADRAPGRTSIAEITLFDSVGLAAQDLALAAAVIARARQAGAGEEVKLTALAAPDGVA